jgi:hypothetical protein
MNFFKKYWEILLTLSITILIFIYQYMDGKSQKPNLEAYYLQIENQNQLNKYLVTELDKIFGNNDTTGYFNYSINQIKYDFNAPFLSDFIFKNNGQVDITEISFTMPDYDGYYLVYSNNKLIEYGSYSNSIELTKKIKPNHQLNVKIHSSIPLYETIQINHNNTFTISKLALPIYDCKSWISYLLDLNLLNVLIKFLMVIMFLYFVFKIIPLNREIEKKNKQLFDENKKD